VQAGSICYRPGEGVTGKVAQTGRPMAIANLGDAALFLDRTGARKALNRKELAFLCVPVFYQGRVVGVLSADKLAHQVENLSQEVSLLGAVAELLGKIVHFRAVEEENLRLRRLLAEAKRPKTNIIGRSKVIQEVLRLIDQVADSNSTVLIYGETGTGKELVARGIHDNSRRNRGPLVQVNCAAMPDTLLESELFGTKKGLSPGPSPAAEVASKKPAAGPFFWMRWENSPHCSGQAAACDAGAILPAAGSSRTVHVDVRVVAATNKDLEKEVEKGRFARIYITGSMCFPSSCRRSAIVVRTFCCWPIILCSSTPMNSPRT